MDEKELHEKIEENEKLILKAIDEVFVELKKLDHNVLDFHQCTTDEVKLELERPLFYLKLERKGKILKYAGDAGDMLHFLKMGLEHAMIANVLEKISDAVLDCSKCPAPKCDKRKKPYVKEEEESIPSRDNPKCN